MEESIMKVLITNTIRELVKAANELGIKKENVVSLIKEGQYYLIYYGE
jgi:hypothetical protein